MGGRVGLDGGWGGGGGGVWEGRSGVVGGGVDTLDLELLPAPCDSQDGSLLHHDFL